MSLHSWARRPNEGPASGDTVTSRPLSLDCRLVQQGENHAVAKLNLNKFIAHFVGAHDVPETLHPVGLSSLVDLDSDYSGVK